MPDPIAGHTAERIPRSGSEQTEQRVEPHPHQNHQHDLGTERQDTPGDESREKKTDITPVGKNCVSEAINSSMPSDSTRYRTDFGSKNKNVSPAPIVFLSAHDSKIFRLVCFMHIRKMVNNELKIKSGIISRRAGSQSLCRYKAGEKQVRRFFHRRLHASRPCSRSRRISIFLCGMPASRYSSDTTSNPNDS